MGAPEDHESLNLADESGREAKGVPVRQRQADGEAPDQRDEGRVGAWDLGHCQPRYAYSWNRDPRRS